MAFSPRLEFRQTQNLVLTPQLMQSIKLLQLSHIELNAFVEAELLCNPLLEREERSEAGEGEPGATTTSLNVETDMVDSIATLPDAQTVADGYDTAVDNVFPDQSAQDLFTPQSLTNRGGHVGNEEATDIDQFIAARPSLGEYLETQAHMLLRNAGDRLIARHLIDGLNAAGYLTVNLNALAEQVGTDIADIEAVLSTLQGCDPPGVFARSVPECLAIQLRERDRLDPMMQRLLDHIGLLAEHDLAGLMKAVNCDHADLVDMLAELRRLDPRPGLAFDSKPVDVVVPDVFVSHGAGGNWQVELNSEVLPRVLVNRAYFAVVSRKVHDTIEKGFLSSCLATAKWLTRSLDQRAQTILKVAAEIVRQQDGFFTHGITHLHPMTLKMVAVAIDVHESTVSRVIANKYMATPWGLYELKYFFTAAIAASDGGSEHSAEAVRHRIRQLIEAETVRNVLSDDIIAAILKKEQGIDVARRTVAKYREGMNIPSSVQRRRQKKNMAALEPAVSMTWSARG